METITRKKYNFDPTTLDKINIYSYNDASARQGTAPK
jgi:hypothetical protein